MLNFGSLIIVLLNIGSSFIHFETYSFAFIDIINCFKYLSKLKCLIYFKYLNALIKKITNNIALINWQIFLYIHKYDSTIQSVHIVSKGLIYDIIFTNFK